MLELPNKIEAVTNNTKAIKETAKKYSSFKDFIFIARGINFPTALEGALKLKEISYINATGYSAGELKHGPIAQWQDLQTVFYPLTQVLKFLLPQLNHIWHNCFRFIF